MSPEQSFAAAWSRSLDSDERFQLPLPRVERWAELPEAVAESALFWTFVGFDRFGVGVYRLEPGYCVLVIAAGDYHLVELFDPSGTCLGAQGLVPDSREPGQLRERSFFRRREDDLAQVSGARASIVGIARFEGLAEATTGLTVQLRHESGGGRGALVDAAGRFVFHDIPPGHCTLSTLQRWPITDPNPERRGGALWRGRLDGVVAGNEVELVLR
ncbi:MAG: hypothetical protein Q8L14_35195 [Myxococcales bacterium]|nr:hypothetical protein [Myxococcales bacterium]